MIVGTKIVIFSDIQSIMDDYFVFTAPKFGTYVFFAYFCSRKYLSVLQMYDNYGYNNY